MVDKHLGFRLFLLLLLPALLVYSCLFKYFLFFLFPTPHPLTGWEEGIGLFKEKPLGKQRQWVFQIKLGRG